MQLRPLSELIEWQLVDPNQDLRGKPVVDESGRSHGAVVELLVDTDEERIASVRTETGRVIPVEPLEILGSKVLFHDSSGTGPGCCGTLPVVPQYGATTPVEVQTGKQLRHSKVEASDGDIGSLLDIYFDDRTWRVRYLVIDTSRWLFGRKVLISPAKVSRDSGSGGIRLNLSRDQIKSSPSWDTDPPVSKQYEGVLHKYYGWGAATNPPGPGLVAPVAAGALYDVVAAPAGVDTQESARSEDYDEHLRSMKEVVGYEIHSRDGSIGHIGDFAFDMRQTRIHALIVYANRIPDGPTILIPVEKVIAIDWATAQVTTTLSRLSALSSPEWSDGRS